MGTVSISDKGRERGAGFGWGRTFLVEAAVRTAVSPSCRSRQVADGEVKAGTLQLTVERLNGTLAKVEESEGALRDKVKGLTEVLAQNSASLTGAQDKNLQLQKALTACDHDRQVLQVQDASVWLDGLVRELVSQ